MLADVERQEHPNKEPLINDAHIAFFAHAANSPPKIDIFFTFLPRALITEGTTNKISH